MNRDGGFVALISVIVITLVLLGTTASLAAKGFLDRFNILEGEAKEISAGLASACAESARIKTVRDGTGYTGGEMTTVGGKECTVTSALHNAPNAGETTICAKGVHKNATTNYRVVIGTDDGDIISWREITKADDC